MNPESESGSRASKKPADSATPKTTEVAASRPHDAPGGISIDFHSAEYNRTDDLNDYSGNYRSFQSLDGVVTADMRHQMERRHDRDALDSCVDDHGAREKNRDNERCERRPVKPRLRLTVISQGRTLIVDKDAERAIACGELLSDQGLTCTLLAIKEASPYASFSRLGDLARS